MEYVRRASATMLVAIPIAHQILKRIGQIDSEEAAALNEEGALIVSAFESWATLPPTQAEREKTFDAMNSWHLRATNYLTGHR